MSILSIDNIVNEINVIQDHCADITQFIDEANDYLNNAYLTEEQYEKVTTRLRLDILDVEKFVSVNDCKPVSDPRAFSAGNIPSPRGLLSNEIFGYTMEERSNIYGYIDLHSWFIDPSCYKTWIRLDRAVRNIVHGVKYYVINEKGEFVEDEDNGETGIEFLRKNIKRIKFKDTKSISKDISVKYLEMNRDRMFIKKYIVIPPFYRDKNTASSSKRVVGLGGVNKLYNNLITRTNALTETQDYFFDATDTMKATVQEIILNIYDFFAGNKNDALGKDVGAGMSGKMGILRRANMSKTANFSSRLVISAPELKAEKVDDLMVSFDKSAVPLYATITEFRDFVMYHARRFFENEFQGINTYPVMDKNGNMKSVYPDSPEVNFSDERIKREMDRFLHGYNNRFVPVELPVEGTDEVYYMRFKGSGNNPEENNQSINPDSDNVYNRRLTWCDVFYIAAVEASKDKQILVTRFPIDSYTNQITTQVVVSSTKETIPMYVNGEFYPYYPKIRDKDIGMDTSNSFVDTLRISNLYLGGMGADYDGDQITCKGVYTVEANEELRKFMYSKENFIGFGASLTKEPGADVIQACYALTKVLSDTKLTDTTKVKYA